MRPSLSLILILSGAAVVAACASRPGPPMRRGMGSPPGGPGGPGGMGRGLFVSPAGEPFRRTPGGPQPLAAWFAQADADHDGAIVWAEFEADFVRYFAMLDADRDGEIAPVEVARYEQEILPEMQTRFGGGRGPGGGAGIPGGGMGRGPGGPGGGGMGRGPGGPGGGARGMRPGGGGRGSMGAMVPMSGAARFGIVPIAHPIMDADINFNRGVSREEFVQAAGRRFAMLNTQNTGRLTLPQIMEARAQRMGPGGRRRGDAPPLGDDGDGEGPPSPAGN